MSSRSMGCTIESIATCWNENLQYSRQCSLPSEGQDGESNEKPINIPQVSRSEFEALLDFLYNGTFNLFEFYSKFISVSSPTVKRKSKLSTKAITYIQCKVSVDNAPPAMFDLLSISLRFEFKRITDTVVAIIDLLGKDVEMHDHTWDLQAVKRINLASRHDALRHWYLPALQSLVQRSAPLTADEGRNLGYHRMAIVAAEREKRLRNSGYSLTSVPVEFLLSNHYLAELRAQFLFNVQISLSQFRSLYV